MFGGLPISEINELHEYWAAFPKLKAALLEKTADEYYRIIATDIKKAVKEHECVRTFENSFKNSFENFDGYLYDELIRKMNKLAISKAEEVLSSDIFARLKDIPLIDKYEAYQLLDDNWTKIAIDLEIIQTEGFEATKVVDPNMVVKKKGNSEKEMQEGWKGRIIPFDLVQNTLLLDEKRVIQEKENKLTEITSEYEELLDKFTEEEKEADYVNEDSFVFAEVKKALKNKDIEQETREKLQFVKKLNTEERTLKLEIKKERVLLEEKTKETIESLSDEQVMELLREKWINPLILDLMQLPNRIVSELVDKLNALGKKYETTFAEVESQIKETEKELSLMIDELEASEFDMQGLLAFKKLLGGE